MLAEALQLFTEWRDTPPWTFVKGRKTRESKAEISKLAVENLKAQPNYMEMPNENTPALRIDGVLFKVPTHNLFHGADRRLRQNCPTAAVVGDVLNASVEVPGVEAPWHYRIAKVNFGAPAFVLITAKESGKAEEVVKMQTLYSLNVKASGAARELNHTDTTRLDVESIANLHAAWQYWNHYNALPKRVAFKNGKLLAFMATHGMDEEQAFDDAAYGGASRLAQMYPEEYREYENALETDEEVQENQPNFYEWLWHHDEYSELTTEEGLREHTPEEWWDRKDESHVVPNALRDIAGEPRFSVATAAPRQAGAYPQLRSMTDDKLLAAAFAARMALGASEKFSDRATKISTVQKMVKRAHPDWDTSKVNLEASRIIVNAKKMGRKMREDIDRGVTESLVLRHLPDRMHEQFGLEMRQGLGDGVCPPARGLEMGSVPLLVHVGPQLCVV